MWKYDRNDPNDPNNPFGNNYKPRFVYELHVSPGPTPQQSARPHQNTPPQPSAVKEAPVKGNSKMVVPYIETNKVIADIPLAAAHYSNYGKLYVVTGGVTLKFNGEIKAQDAVLKTTFEDGKPRFAMQFQADGNRALNNVSTTWSIDPTNLDESSYTTTINDAAYTSTSVSVDGGVPSVDTSTNDNGAGSSGLTFSPVSPTTLTFHYDTEELNTESGNSTIKGQLHLEVNLTATPVDSDDAVPSPGFSQAWNEVKSKAEKALLSGAGLETGNGALLSMSPRGSTPIFTGIIGSMVQALEGEGDNNADDAVPMAMPVPPPEVLLP